MAWLPSVGSRRPTRDPFTRVQHPQRLDLVASSPYDMSLDQQERARAEIRELIASLQPDALDAGSREVLNNLINARTDAALAELDAARDERQAVADVLVGLAAEEVARYKPRYDADLARVSQTGAALAVTYKELTGQDPTEYIPARPRRASDGPIQSSLGPIDLSDEDVIPATRPITASDQDRGSRDLR
jgi:hypothetical protein